MTYCGSRVIELTSDPLVYQNFLSFDPLTGTISVATTDPNDVGTYTLEARIYLQDYPAVEAFTTFTVTIGHCMVTNMSPVPVEA